MKITKTLLRKIIKEEIQEAIGMERDFIGKEGAKVGWNTLQKVIKTTASGREKVDYVRMPMEGEIVEVVIDRTSIEPGFAMVAVEGEPQPVMVPLTDLDLL
tara:strand:+ start:328 stop:630 length:303 start_codon:yes stop_codon:yes gene_type:complete